MKTAHLVAVLGWLWLSLSLSPPAALAAGGRLEITVVDRDTGKLIPCRMHLKTANGKPRRVRRLPFWHDHFVFPGRVVLNLPRGAYSFEIERGPEYLIRTGHFTIAAGADDSQVIDLKRFVDMADLGWWSGELHIHRPAGDIELLMQAEDLHVGPVITWWNDRNQWQRRGVPDERLIRFDGNRYYHLLAGEDEREGGALLYFNLDEPLPLAGASREYPSPMQFLKQARENPNVWVDIEKPFWWDMPIWAASGMVDSIGLANNHQCRDQMLEDEAWGKPRDTQRLPPPRGNGRWSQEIYYHLLNTGLRIPPSAGSASGVLPNPVGYNRMYVWCGKDFNYQSWWKNFKRGRVVVTNGPLMRPLAEGRHPGHVFRGEAGERLSFSIDLSLSTRDKISYLEIIKNGEVEKSIRLDEWAKTGRLPPIAFDSSGWFLIRAVTDVEKTYRFASSGPWYVEIGDQPKRISRRSAQFFLDWVDERIGRVNLENAEQREEVLGYHRAARDFWDEQVIEANAQ